MLKVVSIVQLGWIDFSKTERSKILSVLDLLQENGTLDELGIAPVRDGFSNIFFPGTCVKRWMQLSGAAVSNCLQTIKMSEVLLVVVPFRIIVG